MLVIPYHISLIITIKNSKTDILVSWNENSSGATRLFYIFFSCSDLKRLQRRVTITLDLIFMNSWMGRVGSVFVSCFRSALFWLCRLICILWFPFGRFYYFEREMITQRPTRADSLDWLSAEDSDRCESRDPDLTLIIASWIETSDSIRTTLFEWFWLIGVNITGVTGGVGVDGVWIRAGGGVGIVW